MSSRKAAHHSSTESSSESRGALKSDALGQAQGVSFALQF